MLVSSKLTHWSALVLLLVSLLLFRNVTKILFHRYNNKEASLINNSKIRKELLLSSMGGHHDTGDFTSLDARRLTDSLASIKFSSEVLPEVGHYPFGQHLLLDLYHLDPVLLNDKNKLEVTMTTIVKNLGMSIMGITGKQLQPQGVTIAIALMESHFAIHTYPEFGTAFVDLFTCGNTPLLVNLDVLLRAFGTRADNTENVKWSFQKRGVPLHKINDLTFELSFLQSEKKLVHSYNTGFQHIEIWDFRNDDYWGAQSTDELVVRAESLSTPSTVNQTFNGKEEWSRTLFMDGSLQSNTADEHKYHESLVHPAMLSHITGAARVAIVGGGEGAALREVLKYGSVKHVDMIEIDSGIISVARNYLQQYHNCSFLSRNTSLSIDDRNSGDTSALHRYPFFSCFDDERTHILNKDAVVFFSTLASGYLHDRKGLQCPRRTKFSGVYKLKRATSAEKSYPRKSEGIVRGQLSGLQQNEKKKSRKEIKGRNLREKRGNVKYGNTENMSDKVGYDVIILDLFDPEDFRTDLVDKLYSTEMLSNIACLLRKDGVIVTQIGESPIAMNAKFHQEHDSLRFHKLKIEILERLAGLLYGHQSVPSHLFVYSTFIPSFRAEWSFALLFSSKHGPNRFNSNAASVDLAIRRRIVPSAHPLQYFDGSVMESFAKLPREWQDAYCFQTDRPAICDFFDSLVTQEDRKFTKRGNARESAVALRQSTMHTDLNEPNRWEAVAAVDIPQWTDLGLYDAATSLRLSLDEYTALEKFVEETKSKEYTEFLNMIDRYAYEFDEVNGQYIYCSLDSKMTFVNHGCNSSDINTGSIDYVSVVNGEDDPSEDSEEEMDDFNLVAQRNERRMATTSLAFRNIKKGEALLEDYATFGKWKPPASWCQ